VIANQMNNSNVFIITVDYQDTEGAATELLSQISTPFMNFSSTTDNGIDVFDEVDSALCFGELVIQKYYTSPKWRREKGRQGGTSTKKADFSQKHKGTLMIRD
jgi:hypothetical protein